MSRRHKNHALLVTCIDFRKKATCISDVHSFSHYSVHTPSSSHARRESGGGCQKVTDSGRSMTANLQNATQALAMHANAGLFAL